ncbi:CCA tRNA nucleotidyltransferase [Paenisporosarcina cavernae]|nr:CCA tRNA nucleotidyltransferase [Paenisporosarcina cavernae]
MTLSKKLIENGKYCLEILHDHGFEAFFVGGCVRDQLIGRDIKDIDIATNALPHEVKALFAITVDIGIEHGTVLVLVNDIPIEITTYRQEEEYLLHRRPASVHFVQNLSFDLMRRDFTMNAIAMSKNGDLIDPYKGEEDIKDLLIRAVGNPFERFSEDALRMLRGIRFTSTLGFELEETTMSAIRSNRCLLQHISVERITKELSSFFMGSYVKHGWKFLKESKIAECFPIPLDVIPPIIEQLSFASSIEGWSYLYQEHNEAGNVPIKFKFSKQEAKEYRILSTLLSVRKERVFRELDVFNQQLSHILFAERFATTHDEISWTERKRDIEEMYHHLPIKQSSELAVNGSDLLLWSERKPGPWMKNALRMLEEKVVSGVIENTKQAIKDEFLHEGTD